MKILDYANPKAFVSVIFAHYSKTNCIDAACIHSLQGLKSIADEIIFISTSNLSQTEKAKISPYCKIIECRENMGLDFGSYQFGLSFINKNKTDYLILTNDSVYGPIYPLQETLHKAIHSSAQIFGITLSYEKHKHLQSFFMLFKKEAFTHSAFNLFWEQIDLHKPKQEIILDYEIGLSQTLLNNGLKIDALYNKNFNIYIKVLLFIWHTQTRYKLYRLKKLIHKQTHNRDIGFNPLHILAEKLVKKHRVPYIKKELIDKNPYQIHLSNFLLRTVKKLR